MNVFDTIYNRGSTNVAEILTLNECYTVEQLISVLQNLPKDLEVRCISDDDTSLNCVRHYDWGKDAFVELVPMLHEDWKEQI